MKFTLYGLGYELSKIVSRARIGEAHDRQGEIEVRVPLWDVMSVRRALIDIVPVAVKANVRPLGLLDHIAHWHVVVGFPLSKF